MDEFSLISTFFANKTHKRPDVLLGIGDDCSLLQNSSQQTLAISTDTLVEGHHFFVHSPAQAIGYKSLAVSLSDLAAMGAEPAWLLLSLTMPEADNRWLAAFSEGLFHLANQYNIELVGGNTSRGPLNITTTLLGFTPKNMAITRGGATVGDDIYVTGLLGEAGLALHILQEKIFLANYSKDQANHQLFYPSPRVELGIALRGIASAAIDISDGLAADLNHVLEQSMAGATIYLEKLLQSATMKKLQNPTLAWELALTSGDDYELCFTAAKKQRRLIESLAKKTNCPCQIIGEIEAQTGLRILTPNAQIFDLARKGYNHFPN